MTNPAGTMPPRPGRLFIADEIVSGRVRLDAYPFRYILIGSSPSRALGVAFGGRSGANAMVDMILTAVEFLEDRGWDLVSIDQGGTVACMRRSPRR
jgi:hypothetical protein